MLLCIARHHIAQFIGLFCVFNLATQVNLKAGIGSLTTVKLDCSIHFKHWVSMFHTAPLISLQQNYLVLSEQLLKYKGCMYIKGLAIELRVHQ